MRDPKVAGGFFKGVATLLVEHPAAMAIAARQSPCRKRCRRGASHASDRKDSTLDTARDCCAAGFRSSQCLLWVNLDLARRCHTSMLVRFTPKADKRADVSLSPLSANRDPTRGSKKHRYSMTSSARPDRGSGTVMPNSLAVLRLMKSSTWVACWTGRSAGLSPLRIRPV
jgi:hypothetical protein